MHKGFISIIASIIILAVGFGIIYQYNKNTKKELDENIVLVSQKIDNLGGSVVSNKYGGTGQNSSAWSGLIKTTAGTWATTSLTDSDVPNSITVNSTNTITYNLIAASTSATRIVPELSATKPFAMTLYKVYCYCKNGTGTQNFIVRNPSTPTGTGTSTLTNSIVCPNASSTQSTTFTYTAIPANWPLVASTSAIVGEPSCYSTLYYSY